MISSKLQLLPSWLSLLLWQEHTWALPITNPPIQSIHHTSLHTMVSIPQLHVCTFLTCSKMLIFLWLWVCRIICVIRDRNLWFDFPALFLWSFIYEPLLHTLWNILNTEFIDFDSAFLEDPMSTVWRVLDIFWPFCFFFRAIIMHE